MTDWDGLDPTPQRLDRLVLRGRAGDVALVDRAGTLDFAGLDAAVGSLAAHLAARAAPGDRIASWLPKTRTACLLALACARAGLVHVPVNPLLKRAQVAHILADSGARLLVTQPARAGLLAPGDRPTAANWSPKRRLRRRTRQLCRPRPATPTISRRCSTPRDRPAVPRA